MRVSPVTHVGTFKKRFFEEFGVRIKVYRGLSRGHVAPDKVALHELHSSKIENREWVLEIDRNMTVAQAEEETKKLGFQIQILDGRKLAKNSARLADLPSKKRRKASGSSSSGGGKKGCLVALLLAPFAPWL